MATLYINFAENEVYECGAILVTVLAFPEDDESKRSALHTSLCALSLRTKFDDSEDNATPQPMKPIFALREQPQISRDLKTLQRRLRDRMVAARMAIPFLREIENGSPPALPAGVKRLSVNAMAELVLADSGQSDPENVKARIWRPSLPVIHIAAATAVLMNIEEKNGIGKLALGNFVFSRDVIESVVREAERYEALLAKSSRLRFDLDKLVKLRLVPD